MMNRRQKIATGRRTSLAPGLLLWRHAHHVPCPLPMDGTRQNDMPPRSMYVSVGLMSGVPLMYKISRLKM